MSSTPNEPTQTPASTPAADATPALSFEENLQLFWEKNKSTIFAALFIVFLVIVGKGAYDLWKEHRDKAIAAQFGAADTTEKLQAFVRDYSGNSLASLATLKLADAAYVAKDFSTAAKRYDEALAGLADTPFTNRARLGAALSRIEGADRAQGETLLKQIADDTTLPVGFRCEAAYNLALVAGASGDVDAALKRITQIQELDTAGLWSERASALRATFPAAAASAEKSSASGLDLKLPSKP